MGEQFISDSPNHEVRHSVEISRPIIKRNLYNARYQRNAFVMAEAERLHVTLLWLPTYSPNLNLIERLW